MSDSSDQQLLKRYLVKSKLFRVSRLEDHSIDRKIEDLVKDSLDQVASQIDALIISDFVYGVITPNILTHIYKLHSKYGFQIFGDVQCSSQVGSILKFKNFTLLSPNEREVRIALQDKDSGIEQLSYDVMDRTNVNNFVMKLGSSGLFHTNVLSITWLNLNPSLLYLLILLMSRVLVTQFWRHIYSTCLWDPFYVCIGSCMLYCILGS